MAFLILCAALAFALQLAALHCLKGRRFQALPLALELIPACGILRTAIQKPGGFFGWEFRAALWLWVAGAILLGCLLAWGVYHLPKK